MTLRNFLKYITIILFTWVFVQCEKQSDAELSVKLKKELVSESEWVLVTEKGEPKVKNYQHSRLIFLESNEYEVHKTFEYSGSTYRTPGIYSLRDSLIQLKNMNGREHIGNLYLMSKNKFRIEWLKTSLPYGEGTEMYIRKNILVSKE